jgi:hypothetical protein
MVRQYKTPAFEHRHYELFAELLGEIFEDEREGKNPELYQKLYKIFQSDNPGFKGARFDAAICRAQERVAKARGNL